MKYVILIHSNPQPWGHPTSEHTAEYAALAQAEREALDARFDEVFAAASQAGEIVSGCPLGDPARAKVLRHDGTTEGPFAESTEQLAGFFVIDVASQERAEEIAGAFAVPGDTVELRPVHED